jgi:hypothetical protein
VKRVLKLRYLWLLLFSLDLVFVAFTTSPSGSEPGSAGTLFYYVLLPTVSLIAGIGIFLIRSVSRPRISDGTVLITGNRTQISDLNRLFGSFGSVLGYSIASYFAVFAISQIFFWNYKSGSVWSYLVLWRATLNSGSVLGNHSLIVLSVVAAYFVYLYAERAALGVVTLFKGAISIFFMIGIHEALWYASYLASFLEGNQSGVGTLEMVLWLMARSTFFILIPLIMFVYQSLIGSSKRDWFFFVFAGAFFLIWVVIGFPISSNLTSPTQYFYSVPVNLIEFLSWIVAEAAFLLTRIF